MQSEGKEKLVAASWSIKRNLFVMAIKLAAGIYTGSLGIIAEFVHTFFDLIASLLAYFGIKKAIEPADKTHLYGHERFENFSSLAQSLLITVTSLLIFYEAYGKLTGGQHLVKESIIGIIVMVITLVIDIKSSQYLHRKARETGSPALEADAYHFTTDIFSTGAVILGLAATAVGYSIADIIGAVIVAFIMLFLSFKLGKKAIFVMLDQAPDDKTVERIASVISTYPDVTGYHALRARLAGRWIYVDVSVHLKKDVSLEQAHAIAEDLEQLIIKQCPDVKEVVVHTEPEGMHDESTALKRIFD